MYKLAKILCTRAHELVLKEVDLTLEQGTSIAITGSSGSGKTTLLSIAGLDIPDAGEVYVADQLLARLDSSNLCKFKSNGFCISIS